MPGSRAPDWWCSTCNFKVFGSKPACGKCGKPNPNNSSGGGGGGGNFHQSNNYNNNNNNNNNNNRSSQKLPDWWCSTCNFKVFGSKPACRCGKPNPNWGTNNNNNNNTNTNNNNIASTASTATSSSPPGATQQQQQQQPTWFCQPCQSFQHDAKCNPCGASSSLTMHNNNNNQNQQNQQNQQHHNNKNNNNNHNKKPERTIDWQCVTCNFVVFGNKDSCRSCGAKNPYLDSDGNALPGKKAVDMNNNTQGEGAVAAGQRTRMPDYNCPNCNIVVFGSKPACRKCGYPNPALAKQTQVLLNEQKTQSKQLVDSLMKKVEAAQHQVSSSTTNNSNNNDDDDNTTNDSKSNQQQQQPSAAELQALLAQIKSAQEQLATAEKAANAAPASIQLTPPSYWDNISDNFPANGYTLVDITNDHVNDDSTKMTYRDAIEVYIKECCATEDPRFVGTSTLNYSKVRKVSRIQNDRLWVYYCSNRSMMKPAPAVIPPPCTVLPEGAKNDPSRPQNDFLEFVSSRGYGLRRDVNETVMFHGTSADAVKFIVDQGFDERVSSSGLFGSGCYNACVPSKAFNYIKYDSRTCSGYAFISRVVLGTYHKIENTTDSSLRRPPNGADCVIGTPRKGAAREFIVYDRRQIYPDLLIQLEQS